MRIWDALAACGVFGALWLVLVVLVAITEPEKPDEEWRRYKWWQRP